jgi:hypothetical protein
MSDSYFAAGATLSPAWIKITSTFAKISLQGVWGACLESNKTVPI